MFRLLPILVVFCHACFTQAALTQKRYYAHPAVHDKQGVIAPWYKGQNGPWDLRVRVAAETLKRYPWTTTNEAVAAYPHYVFSGFWQIASNGVITPKTPNDWGHGDLGQRATSVLNGFVDYYRYSGDPAAIAHVTYMADFLLDHCLTPPEHPWPGVFISVPVKGKAYGKCDPGGMIQLDLVASTGQGLLRAYQLVGNERWLAAAKHWGDLLAEHCNLEPNADPWPRYANPESTQWKDNKQTGGVTMILSFLDDLIRLGHTVKDNRLLAARDAGRNYLKTRLLPAWHVNDTWGRYFWDWVNPVQNCLTTPDAVRYMMDHPEQFPNWRTDARNILTLFLNHSSVAPESRGDVYSGAWAYPEACQCCGRSLWYAPFCMAPAFAQYAVQAKSPTCRDLTWRQLALVTYDIHENGVTEDNIDGGVIVNGDWFNIAHPLPLRWILAAMGWMPAEFGAQRENHIMRSSAVVNSVRYGKGLIEYTTFDAPANTLDVLRLAFTPRQVLAEGKRLNLRTDLTGNGYLLKRLPGGDALVAVRHDGARRIAVTGDDPQPQLEHRALDYVGEWSQPSTAPDCRAAETSRALMQVRFKGNQVRLIGRVDPSGGLADVYLDGQKQLAGVDCWNPAARDHQVLYYRNGLADGLHTLQLVAQGARNPYSTGTAVYVEAVQFSNEKGAAPLRSTGPADAQKMIFGYTGREDYTDSQGHRWRPATEFVTRIGAGKDSVAECWWTQPVSENITNTPDPELYRYGVHASEFWANLTVAPGKYSVRLCFAATRGIDAARNCFDIFINGRRVVERLDVAATAGGPNRAADLVFNGITPQQGIIEVRFKACTKGDGDKPASGEAFVQALELTPGKAAKGVQPVSAPAVPKTPAQD